jgi:hypothetical protein
MHTKVIVIGSYSMGCKPIDIVATGETVSRSFSLEQSKVPETEDLPVADLLETTTSGFRILPCYSANADDR